MATFPTLTQYPTSFAIGLIPNRRSSQGSRGGVKSEPKPGSYWGITFTYENLGARDSAVLESFLASVSARGGRFTLENPVEMFRKFLNAFPETLGKQSLNVQLEGEGYSVNHLPGGYSSITIDVAEEK